MARNGEEWRASRAPVRPATCLQRSMKSPESADLHCKSRVETHQTEILQDLVAVDIIDRPHGAVD